MGGEADQEELRAGRSGENSMKKLTAAPLKENSIVFIKNACY